ncbi:MAG TPA: class I SAM-dependent methyltransferase [Gaiellaceae bacterium]|nr:class I SAM-dependent methyltransferase [Gaiellaceae bacterium]
MSEADYTATFRTSTDMYGRFVGRYAPSLSPALIQVAGIEPGSWLLDVGCGPGGLAKALADVVGAENVSAVDPSKPFAELCREQLPNADVRVASAEKLPFPDDSFDGALSQLVVNFMSDAERGVGEMKRVVKPGGTVAACTWDYAGEMTMLRAYWDAAREVAPDEAAQADEATMRYANVAELTDLWRKVGLDDVEGGELWASAGYEDFDDLWAPFPSGIGPAGAFCAGLEPERQDALRTAFARRLGDPSGPFELRARAWYAVGRA